MIFTADWHPANHCSFKRNGGEWNDHCVQFSKGAAIHDLLLYGCIGSGVPYRVLIKGELPSSEEYGVKVAPATAKVKYDTIYSNSIGIDVDPENQIVVCGLAGDYCVLETLKNLEPTEKERFESLRLHFTSLFLQHPKMLEVMSYKDIVLKAKEFTKEYLKHE